MEQSILGNFWSVIGSLLLLLLLLLLALLFCLYFCLCCHSITAFWANKCEWVENNSSQRPHSSAKENLVRIRSSYLECGYGSWWFPQFNGNFLVQSCICSKIFMKIPSACPEIWAKLWKLPYLAMLRILQKFLDPDLEADDFENLTTSSLSRDTSVVKYSRRSVQQFLLKVLANSQSDKQTNKHRALMFATTHWWIKFLK